MTEENHRTAYNNTRILIESSRVIDPQFDSGVLYITGAQLELLRNIVQYLDRRTTFVAAYEQQYYLTPDDNDWDYIMAVVADLQEVLMGNNNIIFGYFALMMEELSGDADGTGVYSISTSAVPAGQIWTVQLVSVLDSLGAPSRIRISVDTTTTRFAIKQSDSPGTDIPVIFSGSLVLHVGQKIHIRVSGTTPDTPILAWAWGYKMQVP